MGLKYLNTSSCLKSFDLVLICLKNKVNKSRNVVLQQFFFNEWNNRSAHFCMAAGKSTFNSYNLYPDIILIIEPRCEKTDLRGFRPGPTHVASMQNCRLNRWLDA